jgi:FkbM family methyltransferase
MMPVLGTIQFPINRIFSAMNRAKTALLTLLGEKRYLSLLAHSFPPLYATGLLDSGYQDIYFLQEFIHPADVCADIGAHLGYYTLPLSRLVQSTGRVIAVEPMSKFFTTLEGLVRARKLRNVQLVRSAVGGAGPWVDMGIPEINRSKKFAYARVIEPNAYLEFVETEKVQNQSGDEIFASLNRLDFVKCDVEGLEVAVVQSMMQTIRRLRPMLLCEVASKAERIGLFDLLEPLGYRTYYLRQKRLYGMDVYGPMDPIAHNHYFIPPGHLDRFKGVLAN